MNNKEYFATVPQNRIGDELMNKVDEYDSTITSHAGLLPLWRSSYNRFYSNVFTNGSLTVAGEQAEYTTISVNHYSNMIQHLKNLATSQRIAWDAKATNSDAKSIKQTIVANSVIDYYNKTLKLDAKMRQVLENSLLFGEGFMETPWNPNIGEIFAVTEDDDGNEQIVYSGDVEAFVLTPNHVIRDIRSRKSSNDWYITRRLCNKFDLAAQYPSLKDKIIDCGIAESNFQIELNTQQYDGLSTDHVYLYTFYHKRTPACPEGRITKFIGRDVVIFDGALPYESVPLIRMIPLERIDSCFGHSCAFDLLPLQSHLDMLYSSIASNQSTFGVNNILVPHGSNVSNTQLDGGLSLIYYNAEVGRPEVLQLLQTSPEIFNHAQTLIRDMELLSGVNSVVRGESPGAGMSGVALSLLQQQAVQFQNGLMSSYIQCAEDAGTNLINILKSYAKTERVISIAGKNNVINTQSFKADDISDIQRVLVEVGNPLTETIAGRVALADNLIQQGLVDAKGYLTVIETGQLEDMLEAPRQNILLIKDENESMMEGKTVVAIISDPHAEHVREHLALLASVEARQDPELVQRVLSHVEEHKILLQTGDPFLLSLTQSNYQPPAPAAPTPEGAPVDVGGAPAAPTAPPMV